MVVYFRSRCTHSLCKSGSHLILYLLDTLVISHPVSVMRGSVLFQLILNASSGIDYLEFYNFIQTIGAKRLNFLKHCNKSIKADTDLSKTGKTEGKTLEDSDCKFMQVPVSDEVRKNSIEDIDSDQRSFQGAKVSSQPYYLTRNHAVFDVSQIRHVVQGVISDTVFKELDYSALSQDPDEFLKSIDQTLMNISAP